MPVEDEHAAREVESLNMDRQGSSRWGVTAAAAAVWCGAFACLHLFWALGGSIGLASSAGYDLAERRPTSFVIFGLFGVAMFLVVGIGVIAATQSSRIAERRRHAATALVAVIGVGLAIRGVALEVLLAMNVGGLQASVGPLETYWGLALWNPWFALGGALFIVTVIRGRSSRYSRGQSQ